MSSFTTFRGRAIAVTVCVSALALTVSSAFAGTVLTLPATGTGAVDGSGLTVTNTKSYPGSGPRPFAIEGLGSGTSAGGVWGETTNTGGIGIYGVATKTGSYGVYGSNSGAGFGGYFLLDGTAPSATNGALEAINSGGSPTGYCPGGGPDCLAEPYGSAGVFTITNSYNDSSALIVTTASVSGLGIDATSNGDGPAIQGAGGNIGVEGIGGTALYGTTTNGIGILTSATTGTAAQFTGGAGGGGTCSYDGGAGWNCTSDRTLKENFAAVDLDDLLTHLDAMPVFSYQMKGSKQPTRYLGPTAQDFKAAFDLGRDDVTINTANAQGVALAAAKGVYQKLKADEATIAVQNAKIAALEERVASQQAMADRLARLEAAMTHMTEAAFEREAAR